MKSRIALTVLLTLGYGFQPGLLPRLLGQEASIIKTNAELVELASGFQFTEGPIADRQGNVYFTDQPNDRIMRWSVEGQLSTFLQPSGRSNGLYFNKQQHLLACADEKNELWLIRPNGEHEVLLDRFQEKLLNGPNDVWVRPDGGIYFTDPFYKRPYWQHTNPEQDRQCVYFLNPESKSVRRVDDQLRQPNGIVGTPDGKTLYVADIGGGVTYRYQIEADGSLSGKQKFYDLGSDGMTIDEQGNIYLTGKGVTVVSAAGEKIQHIEVPQGWTANVCFGGKDHKMLFITASKSIYGLRMNVTGGQYAGESQKRKP